MPSCLPLDRVAPTRRPSAKPSGVQRWSELLFVHWTFSPELVRPLVPPELELDLWDGRAWVGVVPFRMENVRPSWMPFSMDFLETNVRTYVHRRGEPGIFFFSLEASSWLAVKAARIGWGLPYFHAEMATTRDQDHVRYTSRRRATGARFEADYTLGELLGPSPVDTLEHFLLERYLLFSVKNGVVSRGHVHHPPYSAQRATLGELHEDLLVAAGLPRSEDAPASVHFASSVDVEVFGPWPEV